jgi:hypothetical protein
VGLRQTFGAVVRDGPRFERLVRGRWEHIHNRSEEVTVEGRGVRCEWKWTSPVDYCRFVAGAGSRLLRAALQQWPVALAEAPAAEAAATPEVTFLIGHRGRSRLPHLLLTLRSIAAQSGAAVECIVIEQTPRPDVLGELPSWVRTLHQPAGEGEPYRRAATFNAGAALARGRILVLHDNDMLVPQRYAAEIAARIADGYDAVDLKRFIFYLTEDATSEVLRTGRLRGDEPSEVVIQNLRGGSVAITREAYDAIGGFDDAFVGWGGEDVELWERAETGRVSAFGYLPIVHLWHAPQPEKAQGADAPALRLYWERAAVAPTERIRRLRDGRP